MEQWDALVRVALALLVLIPLVYLVTRLYGRRLSMGRTGRALRLVDTVVLGPNRAVYVVEAVDRLLVLGATAQHISLLAEVTDPVVLANWKRAGAGKDSTFLKLLTERLNTPREDREGESME